MKKFITLQGLMDHLRDKHETKMKEKDARKRQTQLEAVKNVVDAAEAKRLAAGAEHNVGAN